MVSKTISQNSLFILIFFSSPLFERTSPLMPRQLLCVNHSTYICQCTQIPSPVSYIHCISSSFFGKEVVVLVVTGFEPPVISTGSPQVNKGIFQNSYNNMYIYINLFSLMVTRSVLDTNIKLYDKTKHMVIPHRQAGVLQTDLISKSPVTSLLQ